MTIIDALKNSISGYVGFEDRMLYWSEIDMGWTVIRNFPEKPTSVSLEELVLYRGGSEQDAVEALLNG